MEVILDRLLKPGTHCILRGSSYRTLHMKEDLTAVEDAA